jgi:tetratricopeptide (TPR) repeat protein
VCLVKKDQLAARGLTAFGAMESGPAAPESCLGGDPVVSCREAMLIQSLNCPRLFLVAALILLGGATLRAETAKEAHARSYAEARKEWVANPTNAPAIIRFGRAAFDHAEFATDDAQRAVLAEEAIGTLRTLVARDPKSGPAHYWLAMNLGQSARTKTLGALKLVREMEREFLAAREHDKLQDFAGPDRNLGQLYFQAPGWPTSIGSAKKARVHLDEAIKLAPDFPANQTGLLEIATESRDVKTAQTLLKALADGRTKARERFSAAEWQDDWTDWDKVRDRCANRIEEVLKAQAIRSKR